MTLPDSFPDGTSNTALLIEAGINNGCWAAGGFATVRGADPAQQPYLGKERPFGGFHPAANSWAPPKATTCVALADGSVRTIDNTISAKTLEASFTAAGGERLGDDW